MEQDNLEPIPAFPRSPEASPSPSSLHMPPPTPPADLATGLGPSIHAPVTPNGEQIERDWSAVDSQSWAGCPALNLTAPISALAGINQEPASPPNPALLSSALSGNNGVATPPPNPASQVPTLSGSNQVLASPPNTAPQPSAMPAFSPNTEVQSSALSGSNEMPAFPPNTEVQSPTLSESNQVPVPPPNAESHLPPPPPSSPFILEDECIPEASKMAYEAVLMDVNNWGSTWTSCIRTFFNVEREAGFDLLDRRLPSSRLRPGRMVDWTKKRVVSGPHWDTLNTGDADAFGQTWWAWWVDVQPAGRGNQSSDLLLNRPAHGLDWKRLHKTGPNGLFFVVVSLVWWRNMADSEPSSWLDAVNDVGWVLSQMQSQSINLATKRK